MQAQSKWIVAVVVTALVAHQGLAGVRVGLDKVPEQAKKAVKDHFPKAEIRFVDKEGKDVFEFALKEDKKLYDVGVTGDGKVLNMKEELKIEDVPSAVKDGLEKKFKGAKIVEVEKITHMQGKASAVTYGL